MRQTLNRQTFDLFSVQQKSPKDTEQEPGLDLTGIRMMKLFGVRIDGETCQPNYLGKKNKKPETHRRLYFPF